MDRTSRAAGFPARCRMKRPAQFERALRAKPLTNNWFSIHLHRNECGFARLGIIASKRVMPKSVSRNFVKRMIREAFRQSFPPGASLDVLVRARRPLQAERSIEGRVALLQLLQAVHI